MKLHSLTAALVAMSTLSVACGDKSDDTTDTGHDDHADHDDGGEESSGEETGGEETGGEETGGEEGGEESGGEEGGDDGAGACEPGEATSILEGYYYDSPFIEGESAVSNSGQIMRQLLITELKGYIGDLDDMVDGGRTFGEGEVVSGLNYYFEFDAADAEDGFYHAPDLALQTTWGDISTKNLKGKIAGNDSATDHRTWTGDDSEFYGWDAEGVNSPETLVQHWFSEIETQVLAYQEAAAGDPILDHPPFLTTDGVDRQQLVQKFLTGAVTFSQGADDYLSNDVEGKGLLASETCALEDDGETCKKYSGIGHAWDEGFGYFGGARNYGSLTPAEIKANDNDANGDGCIDLKTEYNWGGSVNAAKRDIGSAALPDAADHSNFVGDAWQGLNDGRAIIADALEGAGTLSEAEKADLIVHRDLAISAWEGAIAATVVHYINDVRADIMSASPSTPEEFSFSDYAKHWGEAKGFALWFQFNPNSPMLLSDDEGVEHFQKLHDLLGMNAPKWTPDGGGDYMTWYAELDEAKELLGEAYGFTEAQLANW